MPSLETAAGRDKVGLALSGGGFRASLFHIGVLAQLADLGLLRRVEVISTVSGGSVIGALFYLYLRDLLQRKSDEDIADGDYQELVGRMLEHFLRVVQMNLRMRTFQKFSRNLKMFRKDYSRADYIGELFDEHLYRPVFRADPEHMVEMREIKVAPLKQGKKQADFKPSSGNADRLAKVPIILINATDLNSGHNWRFEASRMGEPGRADATELEVDQNLRLMRPPSYKDIIEKQQTIELGLAVGASAAVPGLFPPLAISDLYEGIRVALADGGVHDNQGVQGLIDRDVACTHFVVSDASGPLQDEDEPETGSLDVIRRSSDVQFDRIREEQIIALLRAHGAKAAYLHLRKGLAARRVPWVGPKHKPRQECASNSELDTSAAFGIAPPVQDRLSRVRTDLDSFSDVEAYSLMLDGYRMSAPELRKLRETLGEDSVPSEKRVRAPKEWPFLRVAPWAEDPDPKRNARYLKHLEVAAQRFFKPFRLSKRLMVLGFVLLAAVLAGLYVWLGDEILQVLEWPLWILLLALALWFAPALRKLFDVVRYLRAPVEMVARFLGMLAVALLGAITVRVYLATLNRLFLWLGRVERLKQEVGAVSITKRQV